jgi:hypothetical protein
MKTNTKQTINPSSPAIASSPPATTLWPTTPPCPGSITRSPSRRGFVVCLVALALACFAFSSTARALTINFSTSVDQSIASPGGTGNFTAFIPPNPILPEAPCIGADGAVGFLGIGIGGQLGAYVKIPNESIRPGADLNTAIPSGTGNFTDFGPLTSIDSGNVAFIGSGDGGQQGVYVVPTTAIPPNPIKVADTNTAIPGGTGNFVAIPPNPIRIVGDWVAFISKGGNAQQGVYLFSIAAIPPNPIRVADKSTIIPGSAVAFAVFNSVAFDGANVAFSGGSFGDISLGGVYKVLGAQGAPLKVADLSTAIPSGTGNFSAFGFVAIDPGAVVFEGFGSNGQAGLYTDAGGSLSKIIARGDVLGDKTLTVLRFGSGGFSNGQVVFAAGFADGSQSVTTATIAELVTRCPHSQGYWKNNPALWPVSSLVLGSQTYSQAELLKILGTAVGTGPKADASLILAHQLIAAKLNVANDSDATPVSSTIAHADSLLSGFAGKLLYKVKTTSTVGKSMISDAMTLDNYNKGLLTSGCMP